MLNQNQNQARTTSATVKDMPMGIRGYIEQRKLDLFKQSGRSPSVSDTIVYLLEESARDHGYNLQSENCAEPLEAS